MVVETMEAASAPITTALLDGEDFSGLGGAEDTSMSFGDMTRAATTVGGGTAAYGYLNQHAAQPGQFLDRVRQGATDRISDTFTSARDASAERVRNTIDPSKTSASDLSRAESKTVGELKNSHLSDMDKSAEKAAKTAQKQAARSGASEKSAAKAGQKAASKAQQKVFNKALSTASKDIAKQVGKRSVVEGAKKAAAFGAKKIGSRVALMALGAALPGPGWALAVGVAITIGIELFTGSLGKWIGGLFNASGPSTDSPPSGGNTWLPAINGDKE